MESPLSPRRRLRNGATSAWMGDDDESSTSNQSRFPAVVGRRSVRSTRSSRSVQLGDFWFWWRRWCRPRRLSRHSSRRRSYPRFFSFFSYFNRRRYNVESLGHPRSFFIFFLNGVSVLIWWAFVIACCVQLILLLTANVPDVYRFLFRSPLSSSSSPVHASPVPHLEQNSFASDFFLQEARVQSLNFPASSFLDVQDFTDATLLAAISPCSFPDHNSAAEPLLKVTTLAPTPSTTRSHYGPLSSALMASTGLLDSKLTELSRSSMCSPTLWLHAIINFIKGLLPYAYSLTRRRVDDAPGLLHPEYFEWLRFLNGSHGNMFLNCSNVAFSELKEEQPDVKVFLDTNLSQLRLVTIQQLDIPSQFPTHFSSAVVLRHYQGTNLLRTLLDRFADSLLSRWVSSHNRQLQKGSNIFISPRDSALNESPVDIVSKFFQALHNKYFCTPSSEHTLATATKSTAAVFSNAILTPSTSNQSTNHAERTPPFVSWKLDTEVNLPLKLSPRFPHVLQSIDSQNGTTALALEHWNGEETVWKLFLMFAPGECPGSSGYTSALFRFPGSSRVTALALSASGVYYARFGDQLPFRKSLPLNTLCQYAVPHVNQVSSNRSALPILPTDYSVRPIRHSSIKWMITSGLLVLRQPRSDGREHVVLSSVVSWNTSKATNADWVLDVYSGSATPCNSFLVSRSLASSAKRGTSSGKRSCHTHFGVETISDGLVSLLSGSFPRVLLIPDVSRATTDTIKKHNNFCSPEKHSSARLLFIDVNRTLTTATLMCGPDSCQMSDLYKLKSASNVTALWPERDALLLSALAYRFVAPTTLTPSGFSEYPRSKSHEGSHSTCHFNSLNASPSDWLAAFPLDRKSVIASVDQRLQHLALTLARKPLPRNVSYALAQQVIGDHDEHDDHLFVLVLLKGGFLHIVEMSREKQDDRNLSGKQKKFWNVTRLALLLRRLFSPLSGYWNQCSTEGQLAMLEVALCMVVPLVDKLVEHCWTSR